jgi:hypothetical protein
MSGWYLSGHDFSRAVTEVNLRRLLCPERSRREPLRTGVALRGDWGSLRGRLSLMGRAFRRDIELAGKGVITRNSQSSEYASKLLKTNDRVVLHPERPGAHE